MKAITKPTHLRVLVVIAALVLAMGLLALTGGNSAEAAFPGENGKIAFSVSNGVIFTMNPDGTERTPLTLGEAGPNFSDRAPSWSPDGTKIAFQRDADIYVMNSDGTGQTNLTNSTAGDVFPSWSPDGTKIVFQSDRDFGEQLYVMNADGSNPTRLTFFNPSRGPASWSPDGNKIAFVGAGRDGDSDIEIFTMNPDGSNEIQQTKNTAYDSNPDWSPDGKKLAFLSNQESERLDNFDIYTLDRCSSQQTRLTSGNARGAGFRPSWSPDATKIAFESDPNVGGNHVISVINADGSNLVNITTTTDYSSDPDWGRRSGSPPDATIPPIDCAPTINVPDDITENATSPDGATVTFEVTATDDFDPNPTVSCDPASDSTFPIGTTTVECTVTDASGNSADASFDVVVKGAAEQISDLKNFVASLNLQARLTRSLQAKLNDALTHLNAGRTAQACNKLDEFISEVRAQSGKGIDTDDAATLTTDANRIKAVLACK